jgi:hypothetical protein
LPVGVRAFLAAISVWPDIGEAARRAAEALRPPLAPPIFPKGGPNDVRSKEQREAEALAHHAREEQRAKVVKKLAERIRHQHLRREKNDSNYKAAFEEAWELGRSSAQDRVSAICRDGYEETTVSPDGVTIKTKIAIGLMVKQLETLFPDTWGKRKMEHEHSGSLKLGVGSLSDEELDRAIIAQRSRIAELRAKLARIRSIAGDTAGRAETAPADQQQAGQLLPRDGEPAPGVVPEAL